MQYDGLTPIVEFSQMIAPQWANNADGCGSLSFQWQLWNESTQQYENYGDATSVPSTATIDINTMCVGGRGSLRELVTLTTKSAVAEVSTLEMSLCFG